MDLNYLNENFYLGAYYILKTTPRAEWMNSNVLHGTVLSASRCICSFYPDINLIWSESDKKRENYRKSLGLDISTYIKMEQWVNEEFEKKFYFPDVFNSYECAVEFIHNFLSNENNLKIIGIALPNIYKNIFLEDQDDLTYGVCNNINQSLGIGSKGMILGYEILGFESGGFHSYICNGLEDDYYDKYKLKLNSYGLISTLEEAKILTDFTNDEIEGTEPVLWLPWILLEYPH